MTKAKSLFSNIELDNAAFGKAVSQFKLQAGEGNFAPAIRGAIQMYLSHISPPPEALSKERVITEMRNCLAEMYAEATLKGVGLSPNKVAQAIFQTIQPWLRG